MNRKGTTETKILDTTIQAVERETGLRLQIEQTEAQIGDYRVDAIVRLEPGNQELTVEIKKWAQQANIGAMIDQLKRLPGKGLLAADYINPNMAGKLRDAEVQFIDTAGNAYINQPPVYVYATGNRQQQNTFMPTKGVAKRAYEPTGLKVVFAFLCNPELVNAPYKRIVEATGVAQGTVGWVINGLKAAGFIRDKGKRGGRRLTNQRKLLDRWVEVWPEKLRPKLLLGAYTADDPYWWKNTDIEKYQGYWGGEIAAAKYTDYLKPKVATIYIQENQITNLLRDARLRKAIEPGYGETEHVIIYQPFWHDELNKNNGVYNTLVHPVLTYADLIATGDARNIEVAQRIYDEHIAQHIRED